MKRHRLIVCVQDCRCTCGWLYRWPFPLGNIDIIAKAHELFDAHLADCKAQECVKAFEPLNTLADARRVLAGINQRCTLAGRPKDQANLSCEHCPHCGGGCEVCR